MTQRTPFKFLDAYTQADRDIFCGRDAEIEELHARALQNRLLLVYGPSGVGKTSLIQCGLMNKFPAADRLPLTVRYGGNLLTTLDHAIATLTKTPLSPEASLTEKLRALYFEYFTPITLIFDQLEELFIFGATDERERFAAEIAALLDAPFKLRILFVIREEYLAELTAFETQLPDLFTNRLRIERMSRANARRAIEEPCGKCGVAVEDGLPEQIIARLGASKSGAVELTYLQVVLDKLYARGLTRCADTGGGAVSLTLADLSALGDIGDILGAFLSEQLAALPRAQAALGEAVLKTLVTPDGTKKVLNAQEIAAAQRNMGQRGKLAEIAALLNHFAAVRLLSEKEESGRYELRHDSLARKIFERMTALEKDLLEVTQTIENRYKEYQARGTFLDNAALQYVAPYESRLRFNPELVNFIGVSRRELDQARRKRRIALTAAIIAVFIVISGAAIFSFFKYREAEAQRQRAEQQKEFALKASKVITYELVDELNKLAGTKPILTKILTQNAAQLAEMYALEPDDPRAQREQAANLQRLGDLWMVLGDTNKAFAMHRQSFEIRQRLAQADPANATAQRDLSVSYNKIGDTQMTLGDTAAAMAAYQQSLAIREQLAQADTANAAAQRDLSVSYEKIGDAQMRLGDTAAALAAYQQRFAIAARLAQTDPANAVAQRDLAVSYWKLGWLEENTQHSDEALRWYQQALPIAERLAQADPANAAAQRDLAVSYWKLGWLEENTQRSDEALRWYQQALPIAERLAAHDPANAQAQSDLKWLQNAINRMQTQKYLKGEAEEDRQ